MTSDSNYQHEYYLRNKEKRKENVKRWRETHHEQYTEYNKQYQKAYRLDLPKEIQQKYARSAILKSCEKSPKKG
jgi:hypothetical protein